MSIYSNFKIPACQRGIDVFILNFSEAFSAYLVCQYVEIGRMRRGSTKEGRALDMCLNSVE